jgi:DNA repair exonuclease SbcCD ATPase subunit
MTNKPINPIALRVEGYKRITVAEATFDPKGGVFAVKGENEQGKSSFLDGFEALIAGRATPKAKQPINKNSDTARIIGTFQEEDGATIVVTRTYNAKGTSVVVTQDGLKVARADDILKRFYSHIAIDPQGFASLSAKEQTDTLVRLTGFDPAPLDEQRRNVFATRTSVGQEVTRLTGTLESHGPKVDPGEPVDVAGTLAKLTEANERIVLADDLDRSIDSAWDEIDEWDERVRKITAELAWATENLGRAQVVYGDLIVDSLTIERPDPQPLRDRLASAEEQNARVRAAAARAQVEADLAEKVAERAALTARIEAIDQQKRDGFAGVTMPVPNLTIEDGEVYLDGTPFSQTSPGAVLRTSTAIAMALNPDLRAILIRNAALLDKGNREIIRELAEDNNFLVLMEIVGESDQPGIVFEDGRIRA